MRQFFITPRWTQFAQFPKIAEELTPRQPPGLGSAGGQGRLGLRGQDGQAVGNGPRQEFL
jgi:hypothetical protein